jgi:hypothetical protein
VAQDSMRYDLMVEGALRNVVRETLDQIKDTGLPGEHHLYITFLTHEPGVDIPDHLREKYPHDMTIVLQHQFWDLVTDDIAFSLKLSFNDVAETLRVPFSALTAFADPSVNFGLQFKFQDADDAGLENDSADNDIALDGLDALEEPVQLASTEIAARPNTALMAIDDQDAGDSTQDTEDTAVSETEDEPSAPSEDNVVALDTFRKK